MTAEIVIMNKNAVALAADSAVTCLVQTENGVKQKIYNSSNKVFSLSKYHPVGIMICGSTELADIPLEILIKIYRKFLGENEFETLKDYANDFIHFLENNIDEEHQKRCFVNSIETVFHDILWRNIDSELKEYSQNEQLTKTIVKRTVRKHIKNLRDKLQNSPKLANVTDEEGKYLSDIYGTEIDQIITNVFQKLPIDRSLKNDLIKIACMFFTKELITSNHSEIVISGYGKNDLFPSTYGWIIDGIAGNKIKHKETFSSSINDSLSSTIIPIAQREMVVTFMEGIDPEYNKLINGYLERIIKQYPKKLLDNIDCINSEKKVELIASLQEKSNEILNDVRNSMRQYQEKEYINKIVKTVSLLPKEELAEMAESLVNLTSFKRRITLDAETVGGPIDVAIISKTDGFIWIKRKHYFNPELNHQFFNNYFRTTERSHNEREE